jgi:hypothetical protein
VRKDLDAEWAETAGARAPAALITAAERRAAAAADADAPGP